MLARALLVVAAIAAVPSIADACSPAIDASVVGRPRFSPEDAARIDGEDIDVDCDDRECTVTATYRITVAAPTQVTAHGKRTLEIAMWTDGGGPLATAIVTPRTRTLRIVTRVTPWAYADPCFRDGVVARHPWWSSAPASTHRVLAIETAARPRVHHPQAWSLATLQHGEADAPRTTLWFALPPPWFTHGGPVALAGIASGPGGRARLRGGWEIATRRWIVLGLMADTDVSSVVTLAATAEPTSRAWVLPISLSAGGGPLVQVAPDVRPGARGQLGLALGFVRVVLSTDVLVPVREAESWDLSVALVGGVSL
jgi:hypothetical protein